MQLKVLVQVLLQMSLGLQQVKVIKESDLELLQKNLVLRQKLKKLQLDKIVLMHKFKKQHNYNQILKNLEVIKINLLLTLGKVLQLPKVMPMTQRLNLNVQELNGELKKVQQILLQHLFNYNAGLNLVVQEKKNLLKLLKI